ncbi:hypothetical protein F4780DRAFT_781884 [Xylariomycetidae sp. FL0641]|nr:hypothetical protein F4780DRAFT_781884 [Xylariomycetidae sp. FL0641]
MKFLAATIVALAGLALAAPRPEDAAAAPQTEAWPEPSTTTTFIISVTELPGPPHHPTPPPRPCPTVTQTMRPSNCEPVRCPIPGCTQELDMFVPCGCAVQTALFVDGCQKACPAGCATRTNTLSQLCEATAAPAPL